MARLARGTLVSFDPATWKAMVLLDGSLAECELPVLESCPAQLLAADDEVAVLLFDATDPNNGVIVGPFGAAGLLSSFLELAESAAPATPASGALRLFAHSSHSWPYFINDAGAVAPLGVATLNLPLGAAVLQSATRVVLATHHDALSYADAALQSAYWSVVLPAGWAGRLLDVYVLWAPSSTDTGACRFEAQVFRQAAGVALSASLTDFLALNDVANGTADLPQRVTGWGGNIDLSVFSEGESLVFRLARSGTNANDTFTGAARVLAVGLSVVG